jgi:hypothetical protein
MLATGGMDTKRIIADIDKEISKLQQIRGNFIERGNKEESRLFQNRCI